MPFFARGATRLYYSVRGSGSGIPVLCIAPGGMNSSIPKWASMPLNPLDLLPSSTFRVISMDQRNAGQSSGPLGDGWDTYTDDQLALLDHLGVDRCLLVGSCIGPSYIMNCMARQPKRFPAAVLMQPIGIANATTEAEPWEGSNHAHTRSWFDAWAADMARSGRATKAELGALHFKMFGGGRPGDEEVGFSLTEGQVKRLAAPLLVLLGLDFYHPTATSRRIASVAPRARLVERWRSDAREVEAAYKQVEAFLSEHGSSLGSMKGKGSSKL